MFRLILLFPLFFASLHGEETFDFLGNHFMASFMKCDQEAINDSKRITEIMEEAANLTGAHILSQNVHFFEPQGVTQVLLLSESHASIHTYPEHRACFVDLFTCGNNCDWKPYFEHLKAYLKAEESSILILERTEVVKVLAPSTALPPSS